MTDMNRIGRKRTPAERTLANARENPEAAELHGRCLYEAESPPGYPEWVDLTDAVRRQWIAKVFAALEAHVVATTDRPPPPDDGERRVG